MLVHGQETVIHRLRKEYTERFVLLELVKCVSMSKYQTCFHGTLLDNWTGGESKGKEEIMGWILGEMGI